MDIIAFWDNIKVLIKQANTTQRGLSSTCELSPRAIETWIAAGQLPDVFQAYKIAQALGVSVEYLVTGQEPAVTDKYKTAIQEIKAVLNALEPS